MALVMAPAMRLPMAEGIGGSNAQAKPREYLTCVSHPSSLSEGRCPTMDDRYAAIGGEQR